MKDGYGSVFIRVFYLKNVKGKDTFKNVSDLHVVTSLDYKYAEEEDDEAIITIETGDRTIVDRPEFQKGATLKVIWGYIEGPQSKALTVIIRDVDPSFDDKITLVLTCTDKASLMKENSSQQIHSDGDGTEDVEFNCMKIISDFCKKYGLTLHLTGSNPFGDISFKQKPGDRGTLNGFAQPAGYKSSYKITANGTEFDLNRYKYYPQANKSDYQLLYEMLKKERNGPWVLSGRNETLKIAQRNLTQKPIKSYTYRGGNGQLLSCKVSDKGQITESETESVSTFAFDEENKQITVNNQVNENTQSDKLNDYTKGSVWTGIADALGYKASIGLGASVLNKTGIFAGYTFKGVGIVASLALALRENTVKGIDHYVNPGGNAPKPDAPNTSKWERRPGGVQVRKIYLPNGGVITETSQPHTSEAMKSAAVDGLTWQGFQDFLFGPKYNDVTYTADIEESTKMGQYIRDAKKAELYYAETNPALSEWLKSVNSTVLRQSSEKPEIARSEAENLKKENELNKVKITATAIGDPNITDGVIISILGIGNTYSGNYYIKKCRHTVSVEGGYKLELEELVSNAVGANDEKANLINNQELPGAINIVVPDPDQAVLQSKYTVTASPSDNISGF